jgi:hypothetical protein
MWSAKLQFSFIFAPRNTGQTPSHLWYTSDTCSDVSWFLGDLTDNFLVTTLNYRCIGARGARGKRFADRYGLGFGFWSSREGWVWGFGVRPKTHAHARPGRGVKIYTLHATRRDKVRLYHTACKQTAL